METNCFGIKSMVLSLNAKEKKQKYFRINVKIETHLSVKYMTLY